MPATAAVLSSKALETAITVPSGPLSRNLKYECSSTNSSNVPAITILPVGGLPGGCFVSERSGWYLCVDIPLVWLNDQN